jgi:hypothetical protein
MIPGERRVVIVESGAAVAAWADPDGIEADQSCYSAGLAMARVRGAHLAAAPRESERIVYSIRYNSLA